MARKKAKVKITRRTKRGENPIRSIPISEKEKTRRQRLKSRDVIRKVVARRKRTAAGSKRAKERGR